MIQTCPADLCERVLDALQQRFGIPSGALAGHLLFAAGKDRVDLGPRDAPAEALVEAVDPDVGGLPMARPQATVKPTTDLLQAVGRLATRSVVRLGPDAARRYLAGEDLDRTDGDAVGWEVPDETTTGWVLVRYVDGESGEAFDLGCGLLRKDRLENVVPKGRRVELLHL